MKTLLGDPVAQTVHQGQVQQSVKTHSADVAPRASRHIHQEDQSGVARGQLGQVAEEIGGEAYPIIRTTEGRGARHENLAGEVDLDIHFSVEGVHRDVAAEETRPTPNHHILEEIEEVGLPATALRHRGDLAAQV